MNRKVVIAIAMVVAFFLGAIWTDYVPAIAPLVAFLELGIGFGAGYLFCKEALDDEIKSCQSTIQKLLDDNLKLSKENSAHNITVEAAPKKVRARKKKEVEEQK